MYILEVTSVDDKDGIIAKQNCVMSLQPAFVASDLSINYHYSRTLDAVKRIYRIHYVLINKLICKI